MASFAFPLSCLKILYGTEHCLAWVAKLEINAGSSNGQNSSSWCSQYVPRVPQGIKEQGILARNAISETPTTKPEELRHMQLERLMTGLWNSTPYIVMSELHTRS